MLKKEAPPSRLGPHAWEGQISVLPCGPRAECRVDLKLGREGLWLSGAANFVKEVHGVLLVQPGKTRSVGIDPLYMFLGQGFATNTKKITLKHILKPQNWSKKNKLGKSRKSPEMTKSACFRHVLCHNSAIF